MRNKIEEKTGKMLGENAAGILLAGGYGAIRPGVSKLVESVSPTCDKPIICCVAEVFTTLRMPMVVVVNELYQDQVKKALQCCDHFVIQKERVGNGGAVRICLPFIPFLEKQYATSISTLVILYGDMPLWKPESIQMLIESHGATNAVISMFSITVIECCPEMVGRYGRILKNRDGKIIGVREPYELTQEEIQSASTINPSAWVFHRGWLEENIISLEPHDMKDGHPPEYWLPDLVSLASKRGHNINEVPLKEFWQAMGVNTHKELEEVRVYWNKRRRENMPKEAVLCCCCKTDIANPTEKDFGEFHTCGNYQFEEKFRRCECGSYNSEEYWVRCLSCGFKQEKAGVCIKCQKTLDVHTHLHCRACGNCMNSGMCLCA